MNIFLFQSHLQNLQFFKPKTHLVQMCCKNEFHQFDEMDNFLKNSLIKCVLFLLKKIVTLIINKTKGILLAIENESQFKIPSIN
jgi:hypothetical protein